MNLTERRKLVSLSYHVVELYSRGDNGTKLGSLDSNVSVCATAYADNLTAYVFTFSVAIGPDHQKVRIAGFLQKVAFDLLESLSTERISVRYCVDIAPISRTSLTKVLIGASNKANGSQLYHFRYSSAKS